MGTAASIVLVDKGDPARALRALLVEDGHRVELTEDGARARAIVQAEHRDLLIADLLLPSVRGFELLTAAQQAQPAMPVILLSDFATVETAVEAIKRGAYHYFKRPLDLGAVRATVSEALAGQRHRAQARPSAVGSTRQSGKAPRAPGAELGIVGSGRWLEAALEVLRRAAPSRSSVLLTGPSGTGKELFARAVHRLSGRPGPFVAVSCAALSRDLLESELFGHEKGAFTSADRRRQGRFEMADGGTLFLDEIGDVPTDLQVKLLRAIQERQFERVGGNETLTVDVRIVAATNRDLAAAMCERSFREDLYYRLQVIEIALPALRDRPHDVEILTSHFLRTYARLNDRTVLHPDPRALQMLLDYPWPGNVRELENVIERAVVLADPTELALTPALLPERLLASDHVRGEGPSQGTEGGSEAAVPVVTSR